MVTPNKENFQGRYIITHPAKGSLECEGGQRYISQLKENREMELRNLELYANWDVTQYRDYATEFDAQLGWKKGSSDKNKRNFILSLAFDFPTYLWGLMMVVIGIMTFYLIDFNRIKQIRV